MAGYLWNVWWLPNSISRNNILFEKLFSDICGCYDWSNTASKKNMEKSRLQKRREQLVIERAEETSRFKKKAIENTERREKKHEEIMQRKLEKESRFQRQAREKEEQERKEQKLKEENKVKSRFTIEAEKKSGRTC